MTFLSAGEAPLGATTLAGSVSTLPPGRCCYMTFLSAGEAPSGATTLAGSVSTSSIAPRKAI